jgi:hypothetical protein
VTKVPSPLESEVVDAIQDSKPVKKRRAQVRYKIRNLPPPARQLLDARFAADNFGTFESVSRWLEEDYGQQISASALQNYYRNNFDPMLKAVKTAAMQSAEIMRVTGGDEDLMSGALFRLVQTAIFDLLVQLNKARHLIERIPAAEHHGQAVVQNRAEKDRQAEDQNLAGAQGTPESKYPNKVELAAVTALGRTIAIVSKATIEAKRWREQMRAKLEEKIAVTTEKVSDAAREAGLSPEVEKTIREALMEIKV